MGKIFIVDTSVIMHDPQAPIILADKDNVAVIPLPVLEELEHFKIEGNGKGFNAREAFRILDELRKKGALSTGVRTELGGEVVVSTMEIKKFPDGMAKTNDNRIILTAQKLKNKDQHVKIVSKDRALRIKAEALDVESEDYENDKVVRKVDELYSGFTKIDLTPTTDFVISQIYKGPISANEIRGLDISVLHPNQCCEFVSTEKKIALAIFKKEGGKFFKVHKPKDLADKKVGPINNEQAFASALMFDEELSIITLFGKAGTGKTLMALSVACELVGTDKYDQILVYRPNIEVGQQMGFLPGDIEEKFQPFMYPILDNLARILGKPSKSGKKSSMTEQKRGNFDLVNEYLENEMIVIEPINFIRGRSLHNKIVIVDECQNLTPHEVKTLITRAGLDTKVILTGDPTQIDNPYVDFASNGLSHVIVRFIGQQCFGNILLVKGERSPLSELASNIL